jgi:fructose-1,6-bisphosphatase/inositol monophosphatase family enzyme
MWPWARSTSGGREDVGNGKFEAGVELQNADTGYRDVAAGIAILEEAGGLVTTANPPANPTTAEVPRVKLGSRLYLAIR